MSNLKDEVELEVLIAENEDILQDIHAKNYMGTDDDMPESFERFVENLTLEEVKEYLK
jgi:uncharacterized protein YgfB (UPF0149 family)